MKKNGLLLLLTNVLVSCRHIMKSKTDASQIFVNFFFLSKIYLEKTSKEISLITLV